jgi:hypothetical protein
VADAGPPCGHDCDDVSTVVAANSWIDYLNEFRAMAHLPDLKEEPAFEPAARAHARYMVRTDTVAHEEDPKSPEYTPEGDKAGRSSNVLASYKRGSYVTAIHDFLRTPFHSLQLFNYKLERVGFGEYFEQKPKYIYGAVLNVREGEFPPKAPPVPPAYPVIFPGEGARLPLRRSVPEYPDPLASCPGYEYPAGFPILLQLSPDKPEHSGASAVLFEDGQEVETCILQADTYRNPKDKRGEDLGRAYLKAVNATVIIPRHPLKAGAHYVANLAVSTRSYAWSFDTLELE